METVISNVIIVLVLVAIAVGIIVFLIRAKKNGQACVGCPHSKQCSGKCGCGSEKKRKK